MGYGFKSFGFLMMLLAVGCQSITKTDQTVDEKTVTQSDSIGKGNLSINNQWIIESFGDAQQGAVSKSSFITIDEQKRQFNGNGGCNRISGSVEISNDTIRFGSIISTRMYCEQMSQESLFLKNLNEANRYKIETARLFLYKNDSLLMTLESFR